MDSITQAALGAAMGEAVVGRKMRNRAILWGAWAGTIPDLDVISRLFLEHEVYGLLYHRGLTHSILWTIVMAPVFGWWAYRYYAGGWNKKKGMQVVWLVLSSLFTLLVLGGLGALFAYQRAIWILILMAVLAVLLIPPLIRQYKSFRTGIYRDFDENVSWMRWSVMFFFAFLTHWLIDAGTSYGTQIFEPFSNYRISFNNISIVDPLYTGPLLIGLIIASYCRGNKSRLFWNGIVGIGMSTFYMGMTFYNKAQANVVFEQSLTEQNIVYNDYVSSPTIANSILWQAMVETEDGFYYGLYSMLDTKKDVEFIHLPKNHHLLEPYKDNELVEVLLWFAQGYYNVVERPDGSLQFNQLRFGLMGGGEVEMDNPYIFTYRIREENGEVIVWQPRDEMENIDMGTVLGAFWKRLNGI